MEPFLSLTSRAVSMPENDVDTDIIYPARFLLITARQGLGRYAFYERRHDAQGRARADFPLGAGAGILIAGDNFGCGSSREQAVWALADLGIRCIIAPSFGEIFHGNCIKNGLLPIMLDGAPLARLRAAAEPGNALTVDLVARSLGLPDGNTVAFTIDDSHREALLNGWDEVETILSRRSGDIAAFERHQQVTQPWLWYPVALQEHDHHG